jgi:hypothetical protein
MNWRRLTHSLIGLARQKLEIPPNGGREMFSEDYHVMPQVDLTTVYDKELESMEWPYDHPRREEMPPGTPTPVPHEQ